MRGAKAQANRTYRRARGLCCAARAALLLLAPRRRVLALAPQHLGVRVLVAAAREATASAQLVGFPSTRHAAPHAPFLPGLDRVGPVIVQRPPVAEILVRLRHLRWTGGAAAVSSCLVCEQCRRARLWHVLILFLQRAQAVADLSRREPLGWVHSMSTACRHSPPAPPAPCRWAHAAPGTGTGRNRPTEWTGQRLRSAERSEMTAQEPPQESAEDAARARQHAPAGTRRSRDSPCGWPGAPRGEAP